MSELIRVIQEKAELKIAGGLKVNTHHDHTNVAVPTVTVDVDGFQMECEPGIDDSFIIELATLLEKYHQKRLKFAKEFLERKADALLEFVEQSKEQTHNE
jgi:hypothetical protein